MIKIENIGGVKFCKNGTKISGDNPIKLVNKSDQEVRITITAHNGTLFSWNAQNEIVKDGKSISIQVTVNNTPFPKKASLDEGDTDDSESIAVVVQGLHTGEIKTIEIPIVVQYPVESGSLAISGMVPNPPGNDLAAPNGEYIDIMNISGRTLNLNGLSLSHVTFPLETETHFLTIENLPAFPTGKILRVFTRAKDPDPVKDRREDFDPMAPMTPPNMVWYYYGNSRVAIWNNAENDTAFITNQCKVNIARQTYSPPMQRPQPHSIIHPSDQLEQVSPPQFVIVDPRTWTRVLSNLLEGDVIRITGSGGGITWFSFFNGGRMRLPDGREIGNNHTVVAPSGPEYSELIIDRDENNQPIWRARFYPMPGANQGSLLGFLNRGFEPDEENLRLSLSEASNVAMMTDIGLRNTDIMVPESRDPFSFYLGVNDTVLHDNGGIFFCFVEHLRLV